MEELLELRACLEQHRYDDALIIVTELEEMSKEDKINKIASFLKIIILHLIKRHAEQRSTRSWDTSIKNALYEIQRTNRRRKAGGFYGSRDDIQEMISEIYPYALSYAALEAFEGRYDADELAAMVDPQAIQAEAYRLLIEQGAV
jgi:hypothetical protein